VRIGHAGGREVEVEQARVLDIGAGAGGDLPDDLSPRRTPRGGQRGGGERLALRFDRHDLVVAAGVLGSQPNRPKPEPLWAAEVLQQQADRGDLAELLDCGVNCRLHESGSW
jgi:hypothetical protein